MRSYCIEDVTKEHADRLAAALDAKGWRGPLEGIWYLPVDEERLSSEQQEHLDECGPYMMALERIERPDVHAFKLELLVRARNRMRCSCICYAAPELREQMIERLDSLFRELDIPV
jgi:hypothetical protein